ncbi:MAG: DUF1844 domain-containing protein [Desulfovibrio sp.]|nr:DUF1844 domain-containing protein [Desulfovibrio sp.]
MAESSKQKANDLMPEVNFSTLVLSFASTALAQLGEVPEPLHGQKKVDQHMAKHTIDILDLLKEKTKGNLTRQEAEMLDSMLYELKLKYVKLFEKK